MDTSKWEDQYWYTYKDKHVANGNYFLTFVDVHSAYLTFIISYVYSHLQLEIGDMYR